MMIWKDAIKDGAIGSAIYSHMDISRFWIVLTLPIVHQFFFLSQLELVARAFFYNMKMLKSFLCIVAREFVLLH
jgi:hypothetical protein